MQLLHGNKISDIDAIADFMFIIYDIDTVIRAALIVMTLYPM